MKKYILLCMTALVALLVLQTGCGSHEQKVNKTNPGKMPPQDTLKTYIEAMKMSSKAYTMLQPGYYDSSLARYDKCLSFLTKALQDDNNKGLYLYANEFIQINQAKEAIYDSIKQPDNSIKSALECIRWAKLTHDYQQEIKLNMHVAEKLKNIAMSTFKDTGRKGLIGRQALFYAIKANRVIDSLNIHDMDDSKYEDFQLTSKIYGVLGYKQQARSYDKKYRDLYFKIFSCQPPVDKI